MVDKLSGKNRHIECDPGIILAPVQGGVTVELGDLMFYDDSENLRNNGDSTATLYAFPIEYFRISGASLTLNKAALKQHFLGVAMDEKDGLSNSSSRNISIATQGKFSFPLKPARTIAAGEYFGAAGTTTASDLLNQNIMRVTDSSFALGTFAEMKPHAKDAEVFIRTIAGRSSIIS